MSRDKRWSVAGERGAYGNPEHLLWPDDQDHDLPHKFTASHMGEAWPNTEDSIVEEAHAALIEAVADAARLRSTPPDPPLMQVDHAQPVPSSPDSGESRSSAAGPESEQADPRRAGAPPHEASSYACERADRVEPLEGMAEALARADMNIAWDRLDYATRQHYLGMARSASATLPDWRSVAEDMSLLVQILWARYPAFMPPAELVDLMDSLPEDLLQALMAATGQNHKAAAWDNDHPTCVLVRSIDDSEEQR